LFGRYTGTVKIGIRLIKTKFHYGRIAVVFDPFNRLSRNVPAQSLGTVLSTNYNMIIDLNGNDGLEGGSNYYSIEVPYLNNVGFSTIGIDTGIPGVKRGNYKDTTTASVTVSQRECYNPYLRFYALTDLGFLTSAASSIKMYLSISAGDDYELSIPTVNVSACSPPVAVSNTFYCESMLRVVPKTDSQSEINLKSCVGEKFSSLSEIANRFTAPSVYNNPVIPHMSWQYNSTDNTTSITSSTLIPSGVTLSLHVNTPAGFKLSNYEAIAQLYRFSYGGRRYKFMSSDDSYLMSRLIYVPNFSSSFDPNGAFACAPASTTAVALSGEMVVETNINNFLEVERPFYSNRKLMSTRNPNYNSRYAAASSGDDVVTQFTAITKNKEDVLEIATNNDEYIRLGPCFVTEELPGTIEGPPAFQVPRDPSSSPATLDNSYTKEFPIKSVNSLSFQERTFNPTGITNKVKVRRAIPCNVLEAMGTGAGLTFLQAPPCVVFG
jgi:hypothetical protein